MAFDDPFGDRTHTVKRAQAEVPLEDEPPMEFNQPMRLQPEPMEQEPAPEDPPKMMENSMMKPKFPKYNDRNCNDEKGECDTHRNKILADKLKSKHDLIDITPGIGLDSDTEATVAKALADIPVRDWFNRSGQFLVRGKLTLVSHRFAVIQREDNMQEVKIPLTDLTNEEMCFLAGWWRIPAECWLDDGKREVAQRNFEPSTMTWTASALCHKPLYFEEVQVERYGHTAGLVQPVLSGAHFFTSIAFLPYNMGINPPNECQYALGYYRPGNCAPWLVPPVPLSIRGAAVQAGAVAGVSAIIP